MGESVKIFNGQLLRQSEEVFHLSRRYPVDRPDAQQRHVQTVGRDKIQGQVLQGSLALLRPLQQLSGVWKGVHPVVRALLIRPPRPVPVVGHSLDLVERAPVVLHDHSGIVEAGRRRAGKGAGIGVQLG